MSRQSSEPVYVDGYPSIDTQALSVQPSFQYPFALNPIPDVNAILIPIQFQNAPKGYLPKIANRTSWTNVCLQSENFGTTWAASGSPTRVAAAATAIGAVVLDLIGDSTGGATNYYTQTVVLGANGAQTISLVMKRGTSPGVSQIQLYDSTAAALLLVGTMDFTANAAPRAAATNGGSVVSVVDLLNGFWRVTFATAAATAAHTNVLYVQPASAAAGPTTVYAGGVQVLAGSLAGPYVATTTVARTVSAPDLCPLDPFSYLLIEDDPVYENSNAQTVKRTFGRIPGQQVAFSTLSITKPSPVALGVFSSSQVRIVDAEGNFTLSSAYIYGSYTFVTTNKFYGLMKTGTRSVTAASGGTFTLTYKASTTAALNWNDSNATIAAALNGLASVISDALTFTVNNALNSGVLPVLGLTITVGSTTTNVTMNSASLTPTGATTNFSTRASGVSQTIYIAFRMSFASAHGFDHSLDLYDFGNSSGTGVLPPSLWSIIDANTVAFFPYGSTSAGAGGSQGTFYRSYTPGLDRVGVKMISTFYLPGVTVGITTAADIPIPDPLLNDVAFLNAFLATPTAYVAYDSKELSAWKGPIYELEAIYVNMADC